ncbi:MAG: hypothetical protein K2O58_01640 [Bacteroidales bacterium]|nr:hypothetical protein [Bacteroidales bacterium]
MTKEECFERFARAMEDGKIYMDGSLSFRDICGRLEVAPDTLESCLDENFGLSGEEILGIYRRNIPLSMISLDSRV